MGEVATSGAAAAAQAAGAPDRAAVGRAARRLYAAEWGLRGRFQRWRPAICPFEALIAHVPPGARVLDVGCGAGLFLNLLADAGRCSEGVGVDVDGDAVAAARRVAGVAGFAGLSFEARRPAEALPGGGFDVVSLVDVLHHVPVREREAFVRAAAGCVAPGGVLLVKDMCRRPRWRAAMNWLHDLVLARQSVRHADMAAVEGWAADAGLALERAGRLDRWWYGHELRVFGRAPRPAAEPVADRAGPGPAVGPHAPVRGPAWWALLRPRQWAKNLLVLAAFVFSGTFATGGLGVFAAAGLAVLAFVLASGAVYAFNDAADARADRRHPVKRLRPVAAGRLSASSARAVGGVCAAGGLGVSVLLPWPFAGLLGVYLLANAGYTHWWKAVPLLDAGLVASGFLLRALAGAVAIGVVASPWLLTCTTFLALFLALVKRRQELLAEGPAARAALRGYTPALLDQLITVAVTGTLVTYALYCVFVHGPWFLLTGVFVLAGVGRYLWLVHARGAGGAPEEALLTDRPLWLTVVLWVGACAGLVGISQ